ncbi:MAG TPA: hypothetical protein VHR45_16130 [Thermoanaerobaculia bacterium]|nr:hypothetical protein [Thermoanaerobaculia bacterium]
MQQSRELTDRYRLDKILGSSRSGSVLQATDLCSGQPVAIKLIALASARSSTSARERFERLGAFLSGPPAARPASLPAALDYGFIPDGSAFLVLELLDGVGFETLTGGPPEHILPLLAQAISGLEALAGQELAHHNLSPENVLVAGGRAKLLGLGTGCFRPAGDAASARFRAPELAGPAALALTADWRADGYSLAMTTCQALGATVVLGEASGPFVQMPLSLSFELANDEALRQILERSLRQLPAQRPSLPEIRTAFGLALGVGPLGDILYLGEPADRGERGEPGAVIVPAGSGGDEREFEVGLGSVFEDGLAAAFTDPAPPPAGPPAASAPARAATAPAVQGSIGGAPAAAPAQPAHPHHHKPPSLPAIEELLDLLAAGKRPSPRLPAQERGHHDPRAAQQVPVRPAPPSDSPAAGAPANAGPPGGSGAAGSQAYPSPAASLPPPASFAFAAPRAAATPPGPPTSPSPPIPSTADRGGMSAGVTPAEMLSAVDDLLSALPPAPATPPPAPPARRRGGRAAPSAAPAPSSGKPRPQAEAQPAGAGAAAEETGIVTRLGTRLAALPRPVRLGSLAAGAALLLLLVLAAFWLSRHGAPAAAPAVAAAPAGPPEKPGRSPASKLAEAASYLALGREADHQVRRELRTLSFADQGELSAEGCRRLAALEATLAFAALETLPQDLAAGIKSGDLALLQGVVAAGRASDVPPAMRADFERARSLVALYEKAEAAAGRGDHEAVLEQFHAMEGLSKFLRDPQGLRERAAAELETEAAKLAREGNYDQGVIRLAVVQRAWPERTGIKDLLQTFATYATQENDQLLVLASVPAYERRRKPSEPLDQMRGVTPTPHLEQRWNDARQRLEEQLARLDALPPIVTLRDGFLLEYSRGSVVTLSFRVTDDYQVKTVKLFAKPAGGRWREIELRRSGLGYAVDLPPGFHQNGTVELYVVASDLSGHEGMLGSKEKPLLLRRKQGFERLLR